MKMEHILSIHMLDRFRFERTDNIIDKILHIFEQHETVEKSIRTLYSDDVESIKVK